APASAVHTAPEVENRLRMWRRHGGVERQILPDFFPVYRSVRRAGRSGVRKNVVRGPAGEVEPGAGGKELETGGGEFRPALACQHGVELVFQGMQVEHVVGRVGD